MAPSLEGDSNLRNMHSGSFAEVEEGASTWRDCLARLGVH